MFGGYVFVDKIPNNDSNVSLVLLKFDQILLILRCSNASIRSKQQLKKCERISFILQFVQYFCRSRRSIFTPDHVIYLR